MISGNNDLIVRVLRHPGIPLCQHVSDSLIIVFFKLSSDELLSAVDGVVLEPFLYFFLGFWCGLRTFSFHHRSIAASGQNSFSAGLSTASRRRSSRDSLDSKDLLLVFITFICEKTRSSFPLDAGKENRSWTKMRTLDHSEEVGA